MIILGIDPGTAIIGYGIIKAKEKNRKFAVIDYGCILTMSDQSTGNRLKKIYQEIGKLIKKHKPDLISIENIYFFKNLKTAMPVSQAKGVILLAAAKKNIPVCEVTPLQVKMAVVGYGRAEKKQVQGMIKKLLTLEEKPKDKNKRKDDATDALGVAICGGLKYY
ncbi:crossover junction endodeoxyribonuclease RuvC [Patescibacteria group bacterium]|nr:crossover junction endodeoxyribonuclease RuvC [Patescibacteria group bacterium]